MILEWILILLVAICVLGPKEIPRLASYLGVIWKFLNKQKQELQKLYSENILQKILLENEERAKSAEERYQKQSEFIE